jgi:hypothetical protein
VAAGLKHVPHPRDLRPLGRKHGLHAQADPARWRNYGLDNVFLSLSVRCGEPFKVRSPARFSIGEPDPSVERPADAHAHSLLFARTISSTKTRMAEGISAHGSILSARPITPTTSIRHRQRFEITTVWIY